MIEHNTVGEGEHGTSVPNLGRSTLQDLVDDASAWSSKSARSGPTTMCPTRASP